MSPALTGDLEPGTQIVPQLQLPVAEPQGREMTGAQILCEALIREGVRTVFGYPGGAILPLYDELARCDRIEHVLARHEQGAVHMAEGYAKATGRVGVAIATSGPGATNTVTGLANALLDSTPLVVITGQVPRKMIGTDAFQEIDIIGITRPCTKYNYMVQDIRDLQRVIREAFYIARSGRPGPVLVDVPKDVCLEKTRCVFSEEVLLPGYRPYSAVPEGMVRKAMERLVAARRPVLYVGGGVIHSNAAQELLRLAERLSIPVTPTLMGLGCFPSGHPLSLGMLGMHGTYWANMAMSEADVIFALGVRFDDRVTGALEKFAPKAEIIHADVDPSSIHKNVRAHIPIVGDAKAVLQVMLGALPAEFEGHSERLAGWWAQIDGWKQHAPLTYNRSSNVIQPQFLCEELRELAQPDAIVSTDVGQHQMWLAQYFPFQAPRQNLTSGGLGTMGYGFPAALGAQLAFPERQVIAFVGDGGFQMTAQELATAVVYKTNVKVIVMNNNYLGMVRQWQELFYDRTYSSVDMQWTPDFVKLAQAYNAVGLRADHPRQLREVLLTGLNTPGVVVMDIVVAQEENVYPMVPPGAGLQEMVLS